MCVCVCVLVDSSVWLPTQPQDDQRVATIRTDNALLVSCYYLRLGGAIPYIIHYCYQENRDWHCESR
jgi:hypothetical protein